MSLHKREKGCDHKPGDDERYEHPDPECQIVGLSEDVPCFSYLIAGRYDEGWKGEKERVFRRDFPLQSYHEPSDDRGA